MFKPVVIGLGYTIIPKPYKIPWIRDQLEKSGPTYIKLGQFITNRRDIFGPELSDGLKTLQDRVKPVRWELIEPSIPKDTFVDIDTVPVATASIAQIHKAYLKNGRMVALKVKKPGVEKSVMEDLSVLKVCMGMFFPKSFIQDFERSMMKEFDFANEIRNLQVFGDIYSLSNDVIVPRVYPEYSSDSLITMDFVESDGKVKKARELIRIFVNQLLYENVVHGDLHSGNIGKRGKSIVLYDLGNVISTGSEYRKYMRDFVYNLQAKNKNGLLNTMKSMGMVINNQRVAELFIEKFLKYIDTLDVSSFQFNPDEIQDKIPIQLDPITISLLRSYSLLEGYCKQIDPGFSYNEILTETLEMLYLDVEYILSRAQNDISLMFNDS